MHEQPTIFGRILDGKIPCYRIYENEYVLAFLDAFPLSRGHVLVIPKERVAFMHQLSDEAAAALGRVLPSLARAVMNATGCSDYNILQNNGAAAHQAVFHVHVHIIPRHGDDGVGIKWNATPLDAASAPALAAAIAAEVRA
ncbi:MAG: HIT family protein [Phycisphaerales bacterium]